MLSLLHSLWHSECDLGTDATVPRIVASPRELTHAFQRLLSLSSSNQRAARLSEACRPSVKCYQLTEDQTEPMCVNNPIHAPQGFTHTHSEVQTIISINTGSFKRADFYFSIPQMFSTISPQSELGLHDLMKNSNSEMYISQLKHTN